MPATPAWLAAVEAMLNRGIDASMQATALARRLEATAVCVDLEGVTRIRASASGGRLALCAAAPREAPVTGPEGRVDATISGSPLALLRLAGAPGLGRRPAAQAAPAAATARAAVSGDAEIADAYRQLFKLARPDWEEELARVVGDLPARRLSQFAVHAAAWAGRVRRTAGENIAEYLQEESRDLVSKPELDEFLQGVDALREAADRVAARLARLEQRVAAT